MSKSIVAGSIVLALLATTAYAEQTKVPAPVAKAHSNTPSDIKVSQQKDLSGQSGSGMWDPFRPRNGKVWSGKESRSVFLDYQWAPLFPLETNKK